MVEMRDDHAIKMGMDCPLNRGFQKIIWTRTNGVGGSCRIADEDDGGYWQWSTREQVIRSSTRCALNPVGEHSVSRDPCW